MTTTAAYERKIIIGRGPTTKPCEAGEISVTVEITDGANGPRLSMTGDVWRNDRRDIISGGQVGAGLAGYVGTWAIPRKQFARMVAIWDRWHLNDMRAWCPHQRSIDTTKKVELVSYGLTTDAFHSRKEAIEDSARAFASGAALELSPTARALVLLEDWFKDRHTPPDADSPLAGCYEVKKREQKAIGWLRPDEHPRGMLGRACETCGYKYGTTWLYEELPADVIAEVKTWGQE